ncbi:hypothetical protein D1872_345110 [compost metagenome]
MQCGDVQAPGKQTLQCGGQIPIGAEEHVRAIGPQGEQAALLGQGQEDAGGRNQDLATRVRRHEG